MQVVTSIVGAVIKTLIDGTGPDLFALYSAIVGAVVGAGASAIPTYYFAEKASRDARIRDQEARAETEQTWAFRLMLRFTAVVNELESTRRKVEASIARSEKEIDSSLALWLRMPPLIGSSDRPVEISTDEIALLFAAKKPDLARDVLQLIDRHRVFQIVIALYVRKRGELGDRLGGPIFGDPRKLHDEAANLHGPLVADVESLARHLRQSLESDSAEAIRLLPQIAAAFREYFGDPTMFPIAIDSEEANQPPA